MSHYINPSHYKMVLRCIFNNITVWCWNIEGADEKVNSVKMSKLDQPLFQNTLKMFDILCLQETHLSENDNIPEMNGYDATPHCRKISGNNRYFGGMIAYIKTSIRTGIKIGHNFDVDAQEVTLKKFLWMEGRHKNCIHLC